MKFSKKEIQTEIDKIQKENMTPDFMLVTAYSGFYLDEYKTFRDFYNEEAFFSTNTTDRKELLTELANALIEQSF